MKHVGTRSFIEALQRRLLVLQADDVAAVLESEPGTWNVVSIMAADQRSPDLSLARAVCRVTFADIEHMIDGEDAARIATAEHLSEIFAFVDRTHPGPLLVHCHAGISRSPAVALGLIARALHPRPALAKGALLALNPVCPRAMPNRLVLRLALERFLAPEDARRLTDQIARLAS